MAEKTLEELAKIKLSIPLSKKGAIELLAFIQKRGNYRVNVHEESGGTIQNGRSDIYPQKISGTIWRGSPSANTSFDFQREDVDYRRFNILYLSSIGSGSYKNITEEEADLWREINKHIKEYFPKNKKLSL